MWSDWDFGFGFNGSLEADFDSGDAAEAPCAGDDVLGEVVIEGSFGGEIFEHTLAEELIIGRVLVGKEDGWNSVRRAVGMLQPTWMAQGLTRSRTALGHGEFERERGGLPSEELEIWCVHLQSRIFSAGTLGFRCAIRSSG